MIFRIVLAIVISGSVSFAGQGMGPGPGVKSYSGGSYATPTSLQTAYEYGTQATYSNNITSGSTLIAVVSGGGVVTTPSVSDSVNGSWTQACTIPGDSSQSNESSLAVFYKTNPSAGTAPTVTVSNDGLFDRAIRIFEYSGLAASPLVGCQGQNSVTAGGWSSSFDSGTGVSVTQTHVLILGVYSHYGGVDISTATGYTLVASNVGDAGLSVWQQILTTASGSYDFSGTMASSSNGWTAGNVIFNAGSL